ncbi:hypothetical protein DFQ27_005190 [Actinomortierella ambigua]|uniref:Ankyrin n=1 Tax=Actinomortierella ambigua TaxID=1343610 RepID=A0A9P6U2X4_9FUNG|nr:hypothetical protein DFQ27_005190 [Actinomortierella ambigua]
MRGLTSSPSKSNGRDAAEEYQERILHSTINASRIKSHSTRYGTYRVSRLGFVSTSTSDALAYHIQAPTSNTVSSYLDSMPASASSSASGVAPSKGPASASPSTLGHPAAQAPPRPPRPPGGLLGISNGRGMGYGRSLGSSYDSPLLIHGSFNGHVRSGANLYGGRNQSSGIMPTRSSSSSSSSSSAGGVPRPSTSVFPIQKALEIAMKESKLLHAAATRGGTSTAATGGLTTELATQDQGLGGHQAVGDGAQDHDLEEQQADSTQAISAPVVTSSQPSTALIRLHSGLPHNHPILFTSPYTLSLSPLNLSSRSNDSMSDDQHTVLDSLSSFSSPLDNSSTTTTTTTFTTTTTTSSPYESRSAVHAVRELLDSYPAPSPYCVDEKNRSPLHFAAAAGDIELVEFLLERGVRPDCGRDIAGNMPLHLAIISNRFDVVAALLKAAQLVQQIRGIVDILRPYVIRQQRIQFNERSKERTKERSWDRANKFMRHQDGTSIGGGLWRVDDSQMDEDDDDEPKDGDDDDDDFDDDDDDDDMGMEDDDEDENDESMPSISSMRRRRRTRGRGHHSGLSRRGMFDGDGDVDLDGPVGSHAGISRRRIPKRMDANETELALEQLMNGLSLLEANTRKAATVPPVAPPMGDSGGVGGDFGASVSSSSSIGTNGKIHHSSSPIPFAGAGPSDIAATVAGMGPTFSVSQDIADGNLADSEGEPSSSEQEQDVDDTLPDLLEQMQQVLQAIKLNEEDAR